MTGERLSTGLRLGTPSRFVRLVSTCIGLLLVTWGGGGILYALALMVSVILSFGGLQQPFGLIDYVNVLGSLALGIGILPNARWSRSVAIGVAIVLIAFGLYWLRVAPSTVPEPVGNFLTEGSLFWWIYAVPGVLILLGGLITKRRQNGGR